MLNRLAIIVASCFALALLCACGGSDEQNVPTDLAAILVPPSITAGPASQTVKIGALAQFSVEATGGEPLAYQWLRNGLPIQGATAPMYVTPPVTLADNGTTFAVLVKNVAGSITTSAAVLTVEGP